MKLLFLAILLGQLLVNPISARATTFVPRPLPETTQAAPNIARGKITSSGRSEWGRNAEGTTRLYTYYDLQVLEAFKGDVRTGGMVQIRELGGEKDGIGMQVAGAASFKTGEEVVLMLNDKNDDGSYNIRGLASGKFGIERDSQGTEMLIGSTGEDEASPGQDAHGPWTLDDFRKMVASQIAEAAQTPKTGTSTESSLKSTGTSSHATGASSSAAPQLQTSRDQGASSNASGRFWGYAIVALILLGLLLFGLTRR